MPAINPITNADIGPTNPAAGVIATSPATAPEIAPNALARPFLIHSAALQLIAAAAVAKCVAMNALVGTIVLLKVTDLIAGIRVTEEQEIEGLDITQHGEEAYNLEL